MRELTLDERVYIQQKRFYSYRAKRDVEPPIKTVEDVRQVYGIYLDASRMTDDIIKEWMDKEQIPTHA